MEIAQNRGAFETDVPGGATVIGGGGASAQDALALGHRIGFVGGTDSHHAQPGRNTCSMAGVDFHDHITGGLTAVIAPELTREAIIQALRERRCYATTGARMVLDFRVNGHGMGEEFTTAAPDVAVTARVLGTAQLARLELVCNGSCLHAIRQRSRRRHCRDDHTPETADFLSLPARDAERRSRRLVEPGLGWSLIELSR